MRVIFLDLMTNYVPFEKQATKADGTKINPAATPTVRIFEEGGGDATFDNSEITGSPFNCAIINAKVGNYGVMVDKTLFQVGFIYRALFEWNVDGVDTAAIDTYFVTNAANFRADVSALSTAAALAVVDGNVDSIKSDIENGTYGLSALKTLIDAIDTSTELKARFDEIKGAGWTDETLKAIQEAVEAIKLENFNGDGI